MANYRELLGYSKQTVRPEGGQELFFKVLEMVREEILCEPYLNTRLAAKVQATLCSLKVYKESSHEEMECIVADILAQEDPDGDWCFNTLSLVSDAIEALVSSINYSMLAPVRRIATLEE